MLEPWRLKTRSTPFVELSNAPWNARRVVCVGVLLCFLQGVSLAFEYNESQNFDPYQLPDEISLPWALEVRFVAHLPQDRWGTKYQINVVTWIKEAKSVFLRFMSNERSGMGGDRVHSTIVADDLIVFGMPMDQAPENEILIYHLKCIVSPFTATLVRSKRGVLFQPHIIIPPYNAYDSYIGVTFPRYTRYRVVFIGLSQPYVTVSKVVRSITQMKLELRTRLGDAYYVQTYTMERSQDDDVEVGFTPMYPMIMKIYDYDSMRYVPAFPKFPAVNKYFVALPWETDFRYQLVTTNLSDKTMSIKIRCNVKSMVDCKGTVHQFARKEKIGIKIFTKGRFTKRIPTFVAYITTTTPQTKFFYKTEIIADDGRNHVFPIIFHPFLEFRPASAKVFIKFSLLRPDFKGQYPAVGILLSQDLAGVKKMKFNSNSIGRFTSDIVRISTFRAVRWSIGATSRTHHILSNIFIKKSYMFYVYTMSKFVGPNLMSFPMTHKTQKVESWCKHNIREVIPGDEYDNDCDGQKDEEAFDGIDNDKDKLVDEDIRKPEKIDGKWTSWSAYLCVIHDCKSPGKFQRRRHCNAPMPEFGGSTCPGDSFDMTNADCTQKGTCYLKCPNSTYGWGCANRCPKSCAKDRCDPLFGTCTACPPGYVNSTSCNTECHIRTFGNNCSNLCPRRCFTTCDYRNGACPVPPGNPFDWIHHHSFYLKIWWLPLSVAVYAWGSYWYWKADRKTIMKMKRQLRRRRKEKLIKLDAIGVGVQQTAGALQEGVVQTAGIVSHALHWAVKPIFKVNEVDGDVDEESETGIDNPMIRRPHGTHDDIHTQGILKEHGEHRHRGHSERREHRELGEQSQLREHRHKERREHREHRHHGEHREHRHYGEHREHRTHKHKEHREHREHRHHGEHREHRHHGEHREHRTHRHKENREHGEHRHHREHREHGTHKHREPGEYGEHRRHREHKKHKRNREHSEHRDPKEHTKKPEKVAKGPVYARERMGTAV